MSDLIKPHGGRLVESVLHGRLAAAVQARAERLPVVTLDAQAVLDLELVASGGASPLRGFMRHADYRSALDRQRLATGETFPVPVVLPVPIGVLAGLRDGMEVALRDASGALHGTMMVRDTFVRDLRGEARLVHGTDDAGHPGAREILARPSGAVGGEVLLFRSRRAAPETARELRLRLAQHGFGRVAAPFGTSAAAAARAAGRHAEALVLRTLADVAAIPPGLSIFVAALPRALDRRRARAPRETLLDALVLRNFGVSHLVLGPARVDLATAHVLARVREELGLALVEPTAEATATAGIRAA